MSVINVNSAYIERAGNDIINLTKEIKENLDNTFSLIENISKMTGEWQGKSADEFVREVKLDRKDYNTFVNELNKFGQFLVGYANDIERIGISVK